jgi:nitroimidazol reductase NimA-like FMN-containing flavoprotein (pyridoxamine 5'-phosphate oxidase superfamily)
MKVWIDPHPISSCGRFARVDMQDLWPWPDVAVRAHDLNVSSYGLTVLDREECEALLRTQRVGRVGLCTHRPLVLPVVYALLDADVVFRTAPGEKLIAAALNRTVAFEIDQYDVSARTGWSVIVVGGAEEVVAPEELTRVRTLGLEPWAGEVRDRFVRIRAEEVSGRRIDPDT